MATCPGHTQARLVYKSPVRISAGGAIPNTPIPIGATVLDLHGTLKSPITGLPALESQIIKIHWPDMGIPAIDRDGWKRIAKALSNIRRPLFVACGAGHGRTGTALVILGCLLNQIPKKLDPVLWVRDHYCPCAVESKAQLDYIQMVTERTTTAKPSQGNGQVWKDTSAWKPEDGYRYEQPKKGPVVWPKPEEKDKDKFSRYFPGNAKAEKRSEDPGLDPNSPLNRL